jgi:hypothetical protein
METATAWRPCTCGAALISPSQRAAKLHFSWSVGKDGKDGKDGIGYTAEPSEGFFAALRMTVASSLSSYSVVNCQRPLSMSMA